MASCMIPAKEVEGDSTSGPNWLELPRELTQNILQRLGVEERVTSACLVCPLWWNIYKDPLMWRTFYMSDKTIFDFEFSFSSFHIQKLCRYAVKQSCGHLEEINIETFGDDALLKYIADHTSCLRRLYLANLAGDITDKGWSKVARKLPLLEELDISDSNLSVDTIELIGRCCPLLRSLKFETVFTLYYAGDDKIFAIAKTMPSLRRFEISGNMLTNVGLLAILDGCPFLEYLDLLYCDNLDLSGSLGKRCREQIKKLRLPKDYPLCNDRSW